MRPFLSISPFIVLSQEKKRGRDKNKGIGMNDDFAAAANIGDDDL